MKIIVRKAVYMCIFLLSRFYSPKVEVVVLCYHGFSPDGTRFNTSVEDFKNQVLLLREKFDFISIYDLEAYLDGKKKFKRPGVLITIDDGYASVANIREIIKQNRISPVLFLLSDPKNADRESINIRNRFLDETSVKQLIKEGWALGCHSATHANFSNLSDNRIEEEIVESKKCLEEKYGEEVNYFAYPKGRYTKQVLSKVKKAQYKLAFSMNDEIISPKSSKFTISRIGVDATHGLREFSILTFFWAIYFRCFVKKYLPGLAI